MKAFLIAEKIIETINQQLSAYPEQTTFLLTCTEYDYVGGDVQRDIEHILFRNGINMRTTNMWRNGLKVYDFYKELDQSSNVINLATFRNKKPVSKSKIAAKSQLITERQVSNDNIISQLRNKTYPHYDR